MYGFTWDNSIFPARKITEGRISNTKDARETIFEICFNMKNSVKLSVSTWSDLFLIESTDYDIYGCG